MTSKDVNLNTYNMLILDKNFKQLIELRKLVQDKYAMHVDTCFDVDLAIINMAKSSYQYLLLNAQHYDLADVFHSLEASDYQGKVIIFNYPEIIPPCANYNYFYLSGKATAQNLDPLITCIKENKHHNFNEKELLQKALSSSENIKFLFQKQYNKEQDKIVGYELFTRFSLDSVSLPTTTIIAGIARYGLMAKFADLFFSKLSACLDTFVDSQLAINMSLYDIEKLNLAKLFSHCFTNINKVPKKITLEIAEQDFIAISEKAAASLYQLKEMGYRISIEGVSDIWYHLPRHHQLIDEIKVPITAYLDNNIPWQSFIAEQLTQKIQLVITNIENNQQLSTLKGMPDNIILQGYYLSQPQEYNTLLTTFNELKVETPS